MEKPWKSHSFGFTLIELLVVISIIGVLSTIVFSSISSGQQKARDAYRISQIRQVKNALELYYSTNGNYPSNVYPLTYDDNVPRNWATMASALSSGNFIQATFSKADTENKFLSSLINVTYAAMRVFNYYACSIQDPSYKSGNDYKYSYGYVASADRQSYKIRIYLENLNSSIFLNSVEGKFLDNATTGNTACDKNLHYYCTGR